MERRVLITAAQLRAMVESDAARSAGTNSVKPVPSTPRVLDADEILKSPNPIRWLHDYIDEMLGAADRVHNANNETARAEAIKHWVTTCRRLGLPRSPVPVTCDWVSVCLAYCVRNNATEDHVEAILMEAGKAASDLAMLKPISVVCLDTGGKGVWRTFERQTDDLVRIRVAVLVSLRRLLARLGEVHPPNAAPWAANSKSPLVKLISCMHHAISDARQENVAGESLWSEANSKASQIIAAAPLDIAEQLATLERTVNAQRTPIRTSRILQRDARRNEVDVLRLLALTWCVKFRVDVNRAEKAIDDAVSAVNALGRYMYKYDPHGWGCWITLPDDSDAVKKHWEDRSATNDDELDSAESACRIAELELRKLQAMCDGNVGKEESAAVGSSRAPHRKQRKRASRAANIEALTKAVEEHLIAARDYAFTTMQQGEALLLPRPSQKSLGEEVGLKEPVVSKCFKDKSANWLRACWNAANDLNQVKKWNRRKGDEDAA